MKTRYTQKSSVRQRLSYLLIGLAMTGSVIAFFLTFFVGVNTIPAEKAEAATNVTYPKGSFLVNMGVTPQTVANGLKPYGLVYDLITNYSVPIGWSIEPTKIKDGIDFTYAGTDYKGGTFIIDKRYITAGVYNRIIYWMGQGVTGIFTIGDVTVPIYTTLEYYPRVLVDDLSGNEDIITGYFDNAGIGSDGYTIGNPMNANMCFDVWVNPHGDPDWSTHGNLRKFVTDYTGFIWSQCHAVSMLEGSVDITDLSTQMNFLTNDGLQCYHGITSKCGPTLTESHGKKSTSPYTHSYPTDPVMQFMGNADVPLYSNGSESWFIPQTTGGWRPTTKRLITTSDNISPFEGILMAYGPAFGDTNNGWVMYSSGHDHQGGGTVEEQVAAQRAFLNFMLLCGKERKPLVVSDIEAVITGLNWYTFSAIPSGGYKPYTYSWSSTVGGTFFNPDSSTTGYLSPYVTSPTSGIISCTISDSCSRIMTITQFVTISPSPLPVTLTEFTATAQGLEKVVTNWKTSSETNNKFFTVERSVDMKSFSVVGNVPSLGNGAIPHSYTLMDYSPHPGKSYYRLSQTDIDGKTKFFDPVLVSRNIDVKHNNFNVGPNPFTNYFNLTINSESSSEYTARLYDLNGRMISEKPFHVSKGTSVIRFDEVSGLPKGHYILKVEDGIEISEILRIVKQ
jgi:type IX secretion system substrate protein